MKTPQPFKIHPEGRAFVRGLSIRTKLFFGIGLIVFILVVTCLAIIQMAFTKSFRAIQDQISVQRVERVILQLSLAEKTALPTHKTTPSGTMPSPSLRGDSRNFCLTTMQSPRASVESKW